jgi:predicted RNA-binding Zn ribbon-like protein
MPPAVVGRLNRLLELDDRYGQIHVAADGVAGVINRRWTNPAQLLVPGAEAWSRLFIEGDPSMVRRCEGCTLWFYDRTKAHRRRWCSMALCGNRAKARRHRSSISAWLA